MLSTFIKKHRKKNNLSQEYLANKLGVSRPTFIQIEQNEKDITVTQAKILASIFNMSLNDFLNENEVSVSVKITQRKQNKIKQKKDIRISVPQENIDKFKHVLLYILQKVGGKPNVGMTVIYKLLYFIDFDFYEKHEEQLMGLVYLKNHHGPTPLLFDDLISKMVEDGEIEKLKSKFYQYPQTKYIINPEIAPDLTVLNGEEKEHIDWELQRLADLTAKQLSDLSHKDVPWITAEEGRSIDYESVFYRTHETAVRNYSVENDEA